MNRDEAAAQVKSAVKKGAFWGVGGLAVVIVGLNSYFTSELGYNYVVQDTLFGTEEVITEVGPHLVTPFFTRVSEYKQSATLGFGASGEASFTVNLPAIDVTFADTYTASIPATFRITLPRDTEGMLAIHRDFRSFDNLVNSLLVRNSADVTVVTATQYTGEEFFQGGLNQFKVQLQDQLRQGLYRTERRQVEVEETGLAAVSETQRDSNALEVESRLVWKNVVLTDEDGLALRQENQLERYNIQVTQVTIERPIPETRLDELLQSKRDLVARRIAAQEQIVTAQSEAQAAAQEQEITTQREVQIAQRARQLAVIAAQQQVEVAQQEANRQRVERERERTNAEIDKQRELEIAQANLDIQRANAEAAEFQAQAALAVGLADVEIERERLRAQQEASDVFLAQMQRDISLALYENLANFQVQMPNNVIMGNGSGQLPNNLDALTAFATMGVMGQTTPEYLRQFNQNSE